MCLQRSATLQPRALPKLLCNQKFANTPGVSQSKLGDPVHLGNRTVDPQCSKFPWPLLSSARTNWLPVLLSLLQSTKRQERRENHGRRCRVFLCEKLCACNCVHVVMWYLYDRWSYRYQNIHVILHVMWCKYNMWDPAAGYDMMQCHMISNDIIRQYQGCGVDQKSPHQFNAEM